MSNLQRLAGAAVVTSLLAAACGSAGSGTSATAPADGTGQPACGTASLQLTVDVGQADSGAGSTYYPLDFTNTSGTSCELYGYPGVSFVTTPAGAGRQIGAAALRGRLLRR